MEMTGERRIAAPAQRVWEALNDPEVLRACIPGCQSLDKDGDDRFNAVAEVKIGPIGARFKGSVALSDLDPPRGYTISGQGSGGVAGNAKGMAKVRLAPDGADTILSYTVEAQVGGRMAQLGGPLIDATARQMADRFFAKFGEMVGGEAVAASAAPTDAVMAVSTPALAGPASGSAAAGGGFPWVWAVALGLAILAGFLVGRSAMAEWWVVVVMLLALVSLGLGYDAGRRGGGRS